MNREPTTNRESNPARRATIRTAVDDPTIVAAALEPDNTTEMETRVEDGALLTTIERGTTGGLRSTVDDYVVNLSVATRVVACGNRTNLHRQDQHDRGQSNDNE